MLRALAADGPFPDYRDKLQVFGQFVGSWDVEGRFFDPDGTISDEHDGEWHFGWVLEGRAIQDVLIRPSRASWTGRGGSSECGTTLRVFDPSTDSWRVTWIASHSGRGVNLIGREHGSEIWSEGQGPEGLPFRWMFSDISDDRFLWQGHQSSDEEGRNWYRGQEMIVTRRPG